MVPSVGEEMEYDSTTAQNQSFRNTRKSSRAMQISPAEHRPPMRRNLEVGHSHTLLRCESDAVGHSV